MSPVIKKERFPELTGQQSVNEKAHMEAERRRCFYYKVLGIIKKGFLIKRHS